MKLIAITLGVDLFRELVQIMWRRCGSAHIQLNKIKSILILGYVKAGEVIPCFLLCLVQFLYFPVDPHDSGLVYIKLILKLLRPTLDLFIDALQDHVMAFC